MIGASNKVIQVVLEVADQLLGPDVSGEDSMSVDTPGRAELEPYVSVLLDNLAALLLNRKRGFLNQKAAPLQLSILSRLRFDISLISSLTCLSSFDLSKDNALSLVDMLLPYLSGRRRLSPETKCHILHIVTSFARFGGTA